MKILLEYGRGSKPRGGYAYPLTYALYTQGEARGWSITRARDIPWCWMSRRPELHRRVLWHESSVEVREETLPVRIRVELRLPYQYPTPSTWYFRSAPDRERFIAVLHAMAEDARLAWMQFWRDHPPLAEGAYERQVVVLPAPEEVYLAELSRQGRHYAL